MSSPLAWLHIRLNVWKTENGVLPPSPTATAYAEALEQRQKLINQQQQVLEEMRAPRVVPVPGLEKVRLMREYLKYKQRFGAEKAAQRYPEQAQLLEEK